MLIYFVLGGVTIEQYYPIPQKTIAEIKQIDLLTYMEQDEPDNLKQIGRHYFTRDHDSLAISDNGFWHWHSRHIGGTTALKYLIVVRGMSFYRAARHLIDGGFSPVPSPTGHAIDPEQKILHLPPPHTNNETVIRYLTGRGISREVISYCVDNHMLYESVVKLKTGEIFHNAVFVGYDAEGIPRYGFWRGTIGTKRGEVRGSDKRYSFRILAEEKSRVLVTSEAAIECLSLATIPAWLDKDFRAYHFISGGGASMLPINQYLSDHPEIDEIRLCDNNDEPGRAMMESHRKELEGRGYHVKLYPPPRGGDYNEYIQKRPARSGTGRPAAARSNILQSR